MLCSRTGWRVLGACGHGHHSSVQGNHRGCCWEAADDVVPGSSHAGCQVQMQGMGHCQRQASPAGQVCLLSAVEVTSTRMPALARQLV
jgi:hypothetical protein